jgi:hypothetical protein
MKAMAQQVPMGSSDILFDSEPAAAAGVHCNVRVRSEARETPLEAAGLREECGPHGTKLPTVPQLPVCHVMDYIISLRASALRRAPISPLCLDCSASIPQNDK